MIAGGNHISATIIPINFVGPFETTIEGPYDELMDIVKECQHIAIRAGAPSVASYVKISYKPEGEVLSIERKIGKYHE